MKRLFLPLLMAFLIPLSCAAQPQPLKDLIGDTKTWTTPEDEVQLYVTQEQDSAYVSTSDHFRAHMSNGDIWVHCQETVGDPFKLSDLKGYGDTMLREQNGYGMNGDFLLRAECVTTVAAVEDSIRNN